MHPTTSIRILASENNRRGDLFGRLIADLFVALGYEQPRLNVHKSGRELDLVADHRLEPRRAIGECKATSSPIGGDDLNKLLGVRERERGDGTPVVAYFVSLAGFTETAIEQEKHTRNPIVMLAAADVIRELVDGRILIPRERATEVAGQCRAANAALTLDPTVELLAHERGWIWAVCYTEGAARTHVALIHADGTPLARAIADDIIAADRACGGSLHALRCLNPAPVHEAGDEAAMAAAKEAWREHLVNECGYIHLDGMPADADVGSKRLALENLFVPLHLDVREAESERPERKALGDVLASHRRIALLGAPGAGKSTLLKRLAVAYVDPSRRARIDDLLPDRKWLPLFVRCRELAKLARGSFADLVQSLAQRELVRQHADGFLRLVDQALLDGRVLLLVDGLDEIADPSDRAAFVSTLRTTVLAYPKVAIVVTSREAGFRHVASHLASICLPATLSAFDDDDVRRLSVAWHREVVGDTEKVRDDAESLAASIRGNDRIRQLAVNPLLLTTLLLVKRWVGSLPTRRVVLYGKAVEVLLMTWNVEGHKPIPLEEALPQLCYVASAMMLEGIQNISRPRLASTIKAARKDLESELGYATGSVAEFIRRVEERSSLLMMAGLDVEDGQLVEFFEFRHLTFQEYLTAKAMVEGWHAGRRDGDTLTSVLEPHFEEQSWREVIPLAAALGGKATDALIERLATDSFTSRRAQVEKLMFRDRLRIAQRSPVATALLRCLADEAAARPATIRAALRSLIGAGAVDPGVGHAATLARSRYAGDLREEATAAFLSATSGFRSSGGALALATMMRGIYKGLPDLSVGMLELLKADQIEERCGGALALGLTGAPIPALRTPSEAVLFDDGIEAIAAMMRSERLPEVYAGIVAAGVFGRRDHPQTETLARLLFEIWRSTASAELRAEAAGSLVRPSIHRRDKGAWESVFPVDFVEALIPTFEDAPDPTQALLLTAAWYSRAIDDEALASLCARVPPSGDAGSVARDLLERLGQSDKSASVGRPTG